MRRALIVCLLAATLCLPCRAAELWDGLGLADLAQAGRACGAEVELSEQLTVEDGASYLLRRARAEAPGLLRRALGSAVAVLAAALLTGLFQGAAAPAAGKADAVPALAGALAVAVICTGQVGSMLRLGSETIQRMHAFARTLLPVSAACAAAGGGVAGAAARQMATAAFSDLLMAAVDRWMTPLVYAFLAAGLGFAATGSRGLAQASRLIRWIVQTGLTLLLVSFTVYLTVSGAIAGTADAAAVKTARTAISAAVPVVGRILSDTAETVLVSAGILRNAAGLFGMVTVLTICLVPFLQLGFHYLAFKFAAALSSTVADERLCAWIEQIGTAFGLILGMTGASTLLLLISIISGMLGGMG